MKQYSKIKVGHPAKFSYEQIADAALELGVDCITVKGLANYLKTERATLYRYIKCRDDILELAVSRAVSQLDLNYQGKDWRSYVEFVATKLWVLYAKYNGLANVARWQALP